MVSVDVKHHVYLLTVTYFGTYLYSADTHPGNLLLKSLMAMSRVTCFIPQAHTGNCSSDWRPCNLSMTRVLPTPPTTHDREDWVLRAQELCKIEVDILGIMSLIVRTTSADLKQH